MAFVDRVNVTFKAGDGGNGVVSFHHEKFRAKGGPDGGNGGKGGDVVIVASRNQNTLANFRYQKLIKADSGQPGSSSKRHGKGAADLEVRVPVGTMILNEEGELLADLVHDGERQVIAKGGEGGYGNAHFTSSVRQAPRIAEKGERGQEMKAVMELKMIADVGIVGLPNAGKSTLLSVISNAKPEIADYPFTTLTPNLGVVDLDGANSLLFADIPGLIEGASQGRGLGDEFLRHIERTSVLVHLIDAYSEDIIGDYKTILKELKDYKVDLSKLPEVIALTKTEGIDKAMLEKKISGLKKLLPRGSTVMAISSASGQGLNELLRTVHKVVEKQKAKQAKQSKTPELPVIGLAPDDSSWHVDKTDQGFRVSGRKIERFAARTDLSNEFGEQRLRDIMTKMGISRELSRQGVAAGDKIIIGDSELKY